MQRSLLLSKLFFTGTLIFLAWGVCVLIIQQQHVPGSLPWLASFAILQGPEALAGWFFVMGSVYFLLGRPGGLILDSRLSYAHVLVTVAVAAWVLLRRVWHLPEKDGLYPWMLLFSVLLLSVNIGRALYKSRKVAPPALFCLGAVAVAMFALAVACLTGADGMDFHWHDTYLVASLMTVMSWTALYFILIAWIYFGFAVASGRQERKRLVQVHFWVTLAGAPVFLAQLLLPINLIYSLGRRRPTVGAPRDRPRS